MTRPCGIHVGGVFGRCGACAEVHEWIKTISRRVSYASGEQYRRSSNPDAVSTKAKKPRRGLIVTPFGQRRVR